MGDNAQADQIDKDLDSIDAALAGLPAEGTSDFEAAVRKQVEHAGTLAAGARGRLQQTLANIQAAMAVQVSLSSSVNDIVLVTKPLEDIPEVAAARDAHSKILWTLRQGPDAAGVDYDPAALEISRKESATYLQKIARVSLDKKIAELLGLASAYSAELVRAEYLGRLLASLDPKDGVAPSTEKAERALIRQQREVLQGKKAEVGQAH
jgi:hypothetical protein